VLRNGTGVAVATLNMPTLTSFRHFGPVLLALVGATACTQGTSDSAEGVGFDSDVPPPGTIVIQPSQETDDVAKAAVATSTYQWDTFPSNVPVQDKLCVISGFYGQFSHPNHYFELYGSDANYWLRQDSAYLGEADAGRGSVTCVRHSSFLADAGGVHWLSPWVSVGVDTDLWTLDDSNLWWGSAASFVSGISGEFAGGGEYVKVFQSTSATKPSILQGRTEASELDGGGHSYFVGVPQSGKLVKLFGYRNGSWVRGTVSSAGTFEYNVGTTAGFSSYWLPPRDKAFCYITNVSGNFDGGGERLQITVNGSQWFVKAQSVGGKFLAGSVRCMAYDQRG
jgi:hypothetical protein